MMRSLNVGVCGGLCLLAATSAAAQTCLGRPAFKSGGEQVAVSYGPRTGAYVLGAELATGRDSALFIIGRGTYSKPSGSSNAHTIGVGGTLGYQLNTSRMQFCPVGGGGWAKSEFESLAFNRTTTTSSGFVGIATGIASGLGNGPRLFPFIEIDYTRLFGGSTTQNGVKSDVPSGDAIIGTFGAGVGFRSGFHFIASLVHQLDEERSTPVYNFKIVVPLGGSK